MNKAIDKERRLRGKPVLDAPPVSPLRALVNSSLFYLPVAGLLASFVAWLILEPHFTDLATTGGEVTLVDSDPFDPMASLIDIDLGNAIGLTVGGNEIVVLPGQTILEPGADGQAPFNEVAEIEAGMFIEATGEALDSTRMLAMALRPATEIRAREAGTKIEENLLAAFLFFPLTAVMITAALLAAEGFSSRNWARMVERLMLGTLLTLVFSVISIFAAGLLMGLGGLFLMGTEDGFASVDTMSGPGLVLFAACRSAAWACVGAALGLGMNLARTTKVQLRNSVVGGALGGALGGIFFDPIDRFVGGGSFFDGAETSRLVGMMAVGGCVGIFVALVDRLAREAWIKVRTGPLAGKSFVLYRTPTTIGSSPDCDIYLFKDAEISANHAAVHRVGNRYELEDLGSRMGTRVKGQASRRRRLTSGDQIVLGATVLEFEERAKRPGERK